MRLLAEQIVQHIIDNSGDYEGCVRYVEERLREGLGEVKKCSCEIPRCGEAKPYNATSTGALPHTTERNITGLLKADITYTLLSEEEKKIEEL